MRRVYSAAVSGSRRKQITPIFDLRVGRRPWSWARSLWRRRPDTCHDATWP